MTELNPLLQATSAPPIPLAKGWQHDYRGRHGPLIDMSQAAPSYSPPTELVEILSRESQKPDNARYGHVRGDLPFREVFSAHTADLYGGSISVDELVITGGCNQAFMATAITVAQAGDAILLPTPAYFNHKMTLDMLGIEARGIPCLAEQGFRPNVAQVRDLLDGSVKALALVTPNNPTGAIYPAETIREFYEMCVEQDIWLILDETYRDFMPAGIARPHELFAEDSWRSHLIHLYSFSKAYALPGYRLGALIAQAELVTELVKVIDCMQICAPRLAQSVLTWAVDATTDWRTAQRTRINQKADAFRTAIDATGAWEVSSIGGFFAYVRHKTSSLPALTLAQTLAQTFGILTLPSEFFGPHPEPHLRMAFANLEAEEIAALPDRLPSL